jgi:hypothetical protein
MRQINHKLQRLVNLRRALIAASVIALTGCATTTAPVLLPGEAGPRSAAQAARAIDTCRKLADEQIGRNGINSKSATTHAGKAGAIGLTGGLAAGAAGGSSNVMRRALGAASGGAVAVATKVLLDWNEPDKAYQKYVDICLEKRGHRVLGWR